MEYLSEISDQKFKVKIVSEGVYFPLGTFDSDTRHKECESCFVLFCLTRVRAFPIISAGEGKTGSSVFAREYCSCRQ